MVPVAPEANLRCVLKWSIACSLSESIGCLKLAAILNIAISLAVILCPNSTISKVTITGDFRPECLSTQTVTCGLQQRDVLRVITARDFEFAAPDQPESWREHVCVHWWVRYMSAISAGTGENLLAWAKTYQRRDKFLPTCWNHPPCPAFHISQSELNSRDQHHNIISSPSSFLFWVSNDPLKSYENIIICNVSSILTTEVS